LNCISNYNLYNYDLLQFECFCMFLSLRLVENGEYKGLWGVGGLH